MYWYPYYEWDSLTLDCRVCRRDLTNFAQARLDKPHIENWFDKLQQNCDQRGNIMLDVLPHQLRPPVAQQPRNRYGLIEKEICFDYLGGSSDVGQWMCISGSREVVSWKSRDSPSAFSFRQMESCRTDWFMYI
jgi:hypothetical protein